MTPPDADVLGDSALGPIGPEDMSGLWLVAQVTTNHERRVMRELGVLGDIGAYLPMVPVRRVEGKRKRRTTEALFPGYLFCCLTAAATIADVRRMDSVYGIIEVHNQAKLVRELSIVHMAVQRGEINPYNEPAVGEECRVISGPYIGTDGVLVRKHNKRLFVLHIAGRSAELFVSPDRLEIIPPEERKSA